ncbi:MAG: hypothetical protein ACJ8EW_12360 [Rhizobium sp.]|uniref:hypothetical protein n=1 Tax=Rhizobium sp. TaxID=391 RepID=UPI00389ADEAF
MKAMLEARIVAAKVARFSTREKGRDGDSVEITMPLSHGGFIAPSMCSPAPWYSTTLQRDFSKFEQARLKQWAKIYRSFSLCSNAVFRCPAVNVTWRTNLTVAMN